MSHLLLGAGAGTSPRARRLRAFLVVGYIAAAPTQSSAQPTLAPVVVTAARLEQRADDSFAAVTVLQRDQIEAAQAPDLVTLLRSQPGVEITQRGGLGTLATVFMRGAESRHTLVLVDGVPMSNLNFGLAPLEHVPLAHVERIEIARGNLSSLYGSSALGGVLQIFTAGPGTKPGPHASVAIGASSHDTRQARAALSGRFGNTSAGIDVNLLESDGFNAIDQSKRPGTNPDDDGYRQRSFGAFVTHREGPWSAALRLRHGAGRTAYDSEFGPPDQRDESEFRLDTAVATLKHEGTTLSHEMRLSSYTDDMRADVTAFPYFTTTRTRRLVWEPVWHFAEGQRLTGGLERSVAHLASDTAYGYSKRTQGTVRLGYLGESGAHQWQLNVRHDDYSDFGNAATGLVAYGFRLAPAWRISGSVASGFNAPSFNDLANPFGGNPALRPERSTQRELALQYQRDAVSWRLTAFDNRYRELIGSDENYKSINIGKARIRGLELVGDVDVAGWRLAPSLTVQRPDNLDVGARLARRARVLATVDASMRVGEVEIGATLRHVGERFDDVANNRPLRAHATADIRAQWRVASRWTLSGAIMNLTGEDYETAFGYRQPGRVARVGLAYSMP